MSGQSTSPPRLEDLVAEQRSRYEAAVARTPSPVYRGLVEFTRQVEAVLGGPQPSNVLRQMSREHKRRSTAALLRALADAAERGPQ